MKRKTAFCFDLDGTITDVEILPLLAIELNISDEIAFLTNLTMDGTISFQESFRLRVAILKQISLKKVKEILYDVMLNEDISQFISEYKEDSFVVTGNLNVWIEPLINKLGCKCFSSTAHMSEGEVQFVESVLSKDEAIHELRKSYENIVVVGDSANDVPMLKEADVAIAYSQVHRPLKPAVLESDYVIHDSEVLCKLLRML